MPAMSRRRRLTLLLGVATLITVAMGLLPTAYAWWVGPWRQGVTLHIKLVSGDGEPVPYALVRVFLLTDHGPVLLATSGTYRSGEALVHVFVPRIGVGPLLKREPSIVEVGNKRVFTYELVETGKPIYASVNMEVFAVGLSPEEEVAGVKVFSVDPTYMKWPEDSVTVTVKLWRIPATNSSEHGVRARKVKPGIVDEISWWQYTPILKYATWDGIKEWFKLEVGSKIEIESKDQVCALWACEPWKSAGSTQVTLNIGLTGGYPSGELVRTMLAYFKYVDYTYCDSFFGICEETVYAADTNMDFPKYEYLDESWDGHLPSSPYAYYITETGDKRSIPIFGGYHWDLSVSVGVGVGGEGASLTLGVTFTRVHNPISFLYVEGTADYGNAIKTVSVHGPDPGSYVVTYSNWVG